MRGLTDREYDELAVESLPCGGNPDPMPPDEVHLCEGLKGRGLLCDVADCPCGWSHYHTTPLGHDAMHIVDAIRALDGAEK